MMIMIDPELSMLLETAISQLECMKGIIGSLDVKDDNNDVNFRKNIQVSIGVIITHEIALIRTIQNLYSNNDLNTG